MTKKLILAAMLAAVTGSALAENSGGGSPRKSFPPAPKCAACAQVNAKGQIAAAKRAIAYSLKDPDSVRWRNARVDMKYGNVCIEVNARNSFGGYTGFEVWIYNARFGSVQEGGYCPAWLMGSRGVMVGAGQP